MHLLLLLESFTLLPVALSFSERLCALWNDDMQDTGFEILTTGLTSLDSERVHFVLFSKQACTFNMKVPYSYNCITLLAYLLLFMTILKEKQSF